MLRITYEQRSSSPCSSSNEILEGTTVSSGEKSTSGCPQASKQDSRGPANHVGVAWGDWVLCCARAIESDMGKGDVTR